MVMLVMVILPNFIMRQKNNKTNLLSVAIHTVSTSDFNCGSPFIGFGPELWLRPTGDCAEAADGVQRVWSASWSRPQHRLELGCGQESQDDAIYSCYTNTVYFKTSTIHHNNCK